MSSRNEEILTSIADGSSTTIEPRCRNEQFLVAIANGDTSNLPEPKSRTEVLLKQIAEKGIGSGGSPIVTEDITITPTTSDQVKKRSSGKYINQVKVLAVTSAIDSNISPDNIKKDVTILGVTGTLESGGGSSGTNLLQWCCDNVGYLDYQFYNCANEDINDILKGLNTSKVKSFKNTLNSATGLSGVVTLQINNNGSYIYAHNFFSGCKNVSEIVLETQNNRFVVDNNNNIGVFANCDNVTKITFTNGVTFDSKTGNNMYLSCKKLVSIIGSMDLYGASSVTGFVQNCTALENINLKNIRIKLQLGSGTSWGSKLTLDSLINTVKELWDYSTGTSTYTLTIGSANLTKIADVYVKLIDVTDEMLAADQYAADKLPCEVCESTDEGAMTLQTYATLKNWSLA